MQHGKVEFSITADASGNVTIYIENETDPDNEFVIVAAARKQMTDQLMIHQLTKERPSRLKQNPTEYSSPVLLRSPSMDKPGRLQPVSQPSLPPQ